MGTTYKVVKEYYVEANQLTEEQLKKLNQISLAHGNHDEPAFRPKVVVEDDEENPFYTVDINKGVCVMEAVNFIQGRPHSDEPACVLDVLREMSISLNDGAPSQVTRNKLKTVVPRIVGTQRIKVVEYDGGMQRVLPAPTEEEKARNRRMMDRWDDLISPAWDSTQTSWGMMTWQKKFEFYKEMIDLP